MQLLGVLDEVDPNDLSLVNFVACLASVPCLPLWFFSREEVVCTTFANLAVVTSLWPVW
jgi:hypothetical protein